MTHETKIQRSMHGELEARTEVVIGIAPATSMNPIEGKLVLVVKSYKGGRSNIITSASVFNEHPTGQGYESRVHCFGFGAGGDYSKNVQNIPCNRVTEKTLAAAHASALENIEGIITEAKSFYENKKPAENTAA